MKNIWILLLIFTAVKSNFMDLIKESKSTSDLPGVSTWWYLAHAHELLFHVPMDSSVVSVPWHGHWWLIRLCFGPQSFTPPSQLQPLSPSLLPSLSSLSHLPLLPPSSPSLLLFQLYCQCESCWLVPLVWQFMAGIPGFASCEGSSGWLPIA